MAVLKFPERKDSGTWKREVAPEGHDRFVCAGCGWMVEVVEDSHDERPQVAEACAAELR